MYFEKLHIFGHIYIGFWSCIVFIQYKISIYNMLIMFACITAYTLNTCTVPIIQLLILTVLITMTRVAWLTHLHLWSVSFDNVSCVTSAACKSFPTNWIDTIIYTFCYSSEDTVLLRVRVRWHFLSQSQWSLLLRMVISLMYQKWRRHLLRTGLGYVCVCVGLCLINKHHSSKAS